MGIVQKTTVIMMLTYLFLYPILSASGLMPSAFSTTKSQLSAFVNTETASIDGSTAMDTLPDSLVSDTAIVGTQSMSIVSTMRMVWEFAEWILTAMIGGLFVLLLKMNMPIIICIFLGLPFTIIQIFGVISFIRGWDL